MSEIIYLREVDSGTPNACWFVCNKVDPGAVAFLSAADAAAICKEKEAAFLTPEYATDQPGSSFSERFACRQIAAEFNAIAGEA